jgi:4'-phosphopantetheinyl transferase
MRWQEIVPARTASGIHAAVWRVDLNEWPAAPEVDELSQAERARAKRFVFDADRRRYLAAHCALRSLLARHVGRSAVSLSFDEGAQGKPGLSGWPDCQFNLSHGHDVALIAVGDGSALGVDVEMLRAVDDATELADVHFTPAEQHELRTAPAHERDRLFLSGWTRKEACLKAIGSGLSLPANRVEAGLAAQPRELSVKTDHGSIALRVHSLEAGDDVVAALACVLEPAT